MNSKNTLPSWAPRLIVTVLFAVFITIAASYVLLQLTDLLSWILVSLFLSFALEPLVTQLVHRGWSRNLATGFVLFVFSGLVILLVATMIPLVVQQITEVVKQSPAWLTSLISYINNAAGTTISQADVLEKLAISDQALARYASSIADNIVGFGRQLFYTLLQILAIILFTFYFVSDGPYLRRVICSFLSPKHQKIVLSTWELAIDKTGGYMVSRLILGAISTIAHYIILVILGVPFALPLAIWIGVVSQFLPIIGTYIAAALPLVVALLQSPSDAALLAVFIIAYQQVENYILGPKIAAHTMELHPAVAFAAVIAGASIGGIVGAFIALPVAAMLQEIAYVYVSRNEVIESKLTQAAPRKRKRKVAKT
jgi:predicted PurR-regulated permease PerM